jgi:lipopolysaccharide transport system permease protein
MDSSNRKGRRGASPRHEPWRWIYRHRDLLRQLVRRDIEARYRGSYLGLAWSVVTPLVLLTIYTFVFSVVFRARWRPEAESTRAEFAIVLFAGLIAFNFFSECVSRAPSLLAANATFVRRVVFPLHILPASAPAERGSTRSSAS